MRPRRVKLSEDVLPRVTTDSFLPLPRSSPPWSSFCRLMSKLLPQSVPIQMARLRRVGFDNDLGGALLLAVAYYLGAEAAFFVGTLSDKIFAPFWPPNIVLLCALLLSPTRRWWLFIVAVFPAHVIAEIGVGMGAQQLLVAFATNCAVAMVNAAALRRLTGGPPWFGSLRNACLYIAVTAVASPALVALGGA